MALENDLASTIEFAENPEPRCPCVLLLDTSRSMEGDPIDALNAGVQSFRNELIKDTVAARRVEVAVVSFDSEIHVVQPFVVAREFQAPTLTAQGFTCMGTAINKALDLVQERKALYRANGISYYRPWVLMITDGDPYGDPDLVIEEARRRVHDEEEHGHVAFFAVGVEHAAMIALSKMVVRPPIKLEGLKFVEMFSWLSTSMQRASRSQMGEQIPLPSSGVQRY